MSGLLGALGGLGQGLSQAGQSMYSNALEEIRMRRLAELQIQSEQRAEDRGIRAEGRQQAWAIDTEGRQATRQDEVYARSFNDQRALLEDQRNYDRGMIEDARGYESGEKRDFLQFQRGLDKDRYEPIFGPDGSVIERDTHSGQTKAVLSGRSPGKASGPDSQKEYNDFVKDWRDAVTKYQTDIMKNDMIDPENQERLLMEGTEQINAQFRKDARMRGFPLPGEGVGAQNLIQDGGKTYTMIDGKVYELDAGDMESAGPARDSAGRQVDRLKADRGKGDSEQKAESPGPLDRVGSAVRQAFNVREGGLLEHPEDFKNIPDTIRSAANLPEGGLLEVLDQKAEATPTRQSQRAAARPAFTASDVIDTAREAKDALINLDQTEPARTTKRRGSGARTRSADDWSQHADAIHEMLAGGEQLDAAAKGEIIEQLKLLLVSAPDEAGRRRIQFYLDRLQGTP